MASCIAELQPPFVFEPGSSWGYSNSNYALLGLVVARASGESYPSFLARRLFAPAGLKHTAFDDPADVVPRRARGYRASKTEPGRYHNADWISPTMPGPAGGLRSTAGDLLRWHAALFDGRILSPASLARMTTPGRLADGRTTRAAMPAAMQAAWGSDYAMGVLVGSPDGRPRVWHSGDIDGFSSWAAYYPDQRISIVILQNSQSAERNEAAIERIVLDALGPEHRAGK
ncbi:serine hydrolase domain-containing protein [Nannocystis pusilla]|uniref:serine hydrolase domain-containing protein n=1 Tax=Nannocystis pusilla TaxID=889268 RepID=UPI003B79C508